MTLRIKVNRRSPAYHRLMIAGFKIPNIQLIKKDEDIYRAIIKIKCVCGTIEYLKGGKWAGLGKHDIPRMLDVAKLVEEAGAISIQHLREDGYNEDQIKYIRRAYK